MCELFRENSSTLTDVHPKVLGSASQGAVCGLWHGLVGLVPRPGGAVRGGRRLPEDPVASPVLAFPVPTARPVRLQDTAARRTAMRRAARQVRRPSAVSAQSPPLGPPRWCPSVEPLPACPVAGAGSAVMASVAEVPRRAVLVGLSSCLRLRPRPVLGHHARFLLVLP